jgi:hypothetical protein
LGVLQEASKNKTKKLIDLLSVLLLNVKEQGKNLTIENKTQIENVLVKSALFS